MIVTTKMRQFLKANKIAYKVDVLILTLTGIPHQGTLPLVVYPQSYSQLKMVYEYVLNHHLTFDVLGAITNTYLSSSYHRDVIIKTTRLRTIEHGTDTLRVACGCMLSRVAKELSMQGYEGYEGFVGIPGTIGAAAINNSGAFNSIMSKVVRSVTLLTPSLQTKTYTNKELHYGPRTSLLKGIHDGSVLLYVDLDVTRRGQKDEIDRIIQKNELYRRTYIDGKRKSLGTCFVASSMHHLYRRHHMRMMFKKMASFLIKPFISSQEMNCFLDFLFLGCPAMARHCDSLNRFAWDKHTTEQDFFRYIDTMQSLAGNNLNLEIEIRR